MLHEQVLEIASFSHRPYLRPDPYFLDSTNSGYIADLLFRLGGRVESAQDGKEQTLQLLWLNMSQTHQRCRLKCKTLRALRCERSTRVQHENNPRKDFLLAKPIYQVECFIFRQVKIQGQQVWLEQETFVHRLLARMCNFDRCFFA